MRTAVLLGSNSDIGRGLADRLDADGWLVKRIGRPLSRESARLAGEFSSQDRKWDLLINAIGTLDPVGKFFDADFERWKDGFNSNLIEPLRALHTLWPLRSSLPHIMFMAGGGTNGPMPNHSAYCAAKIALIKLCELLDDETEKANFFIIGPGFVHSKIHNATIDAGAEFATKTLAFKQTPGTSIDEIYSHMRWCMTQGRRLVGGRNFSTVHDKWRSSDWRKRDMWLASGMPDDPNMFRLRRREP